MRKMLACCAVLAMLLALPGCGKAEDSPVSLYEEGMDVVSLMAEMVRSEEYGAMMSSSGDIQAIGETFAAGDYTKPEAVYAVSAPSLQALQELFGGEMALDGLSERLADYVEGQLPGMVINQLNAQAGVAALAATSVYRVGKTFAYAELEETVIYVYSFAEGAPAAVVFVPGEGGTVSASGQFLMNDALSESGEMQTALETAFQLYGCSVTLLDTAEN